MGRPHFPVSERGIFFVLPFHDKYTSSPPIYKDWFVSHTLNRPELGLAYYGITLIPPETLDAYLEIIWKNPKLSDLAALLIEAKEKRAFVIHFGI